MLNAKPTRMAHNLELHGLASESLGQLEANRNSIRSDICANLSQWALDCAGPHGNLYLQNSSTNSFQMRQAYNLQQTHFSEEKIFHSTSQLTSLVTNHLLEPTRSLEQKLDYYFSDIWQISGDERTNKLPFIGAGPWKLLWATCLYLLLIKWLLPRLMRPFEAFELNWPIRAYNFLMVLSNMWAFYHGARILDFGRQCFGCETINHRDYSPKSLELLHYGWLFLVSRLVEWLDTIFFVLRKRERQVTKLHVFHHSFVPLISWTYLKYHPGYTVAFFPFVNSFVHSIMYTYYLLATFGPSIQPYLWWKRYLTSLQIAQFILIIIQLASIPLTGDETCQYPRGFLYVAFAGAILFLWLFFTYYIDTYSKSRRMNSKLEERRSKFFNQLMTKREGSSNSLSEAIDDAISDPAECDMAKKLA